MKWTIAAVLLTAAMMILAIGLVDTSHVGARGWAATRALQR